MVSVNPEVVLPAQAKGDPQPPDVYGDPGVLLVPGVPHPNTEATK